MSTSEQSMGAFEAKTRFSEVLNRVERGETITITRHGRPVARIVPEDQHHLDRTREAVRRLKALRGSLRGVRMDELIESIHEGHRH
jgi:prevent-host-death family protein